MQALETSLTQIQNTEVDRNAKLAQALADLEQMKSSLQTLSGDLETQQHLIQEGSIKAEKAYRDLEMRLAAFEAQLKVYQVQISKALSQMAPKVAEEGKLYEKGLAQVQDADLLTALGTFQQYLKAYPKGSFAKDAQFWIAECRFSLGDYEQSIKDYQKGIDTYPKAAQVPGALLHQGKAFLKLGMSDAAKTFLNKLIKDYASAPESAEAQKLLAPPPPAGSPPATPPPPATQDRQKSLENGEF